MNLDHDRWGGVSFRVSQDKLHARGQQEGKFTRAYQIVFIHKYDQ